MSLDYYASSPALVLPPRTHYFENHHGLTPGEHSPSLSPSNCPGASARMSAIRPRFPRPPSLNYLATSSPLAGRKRSRDDSVEPQLELADGSKAVPQFPPKTKPEPIYGPGMTLIYPDEPSFSIAADSQTGTWAEEKAKKEEDERDTQAKRPAPSSRKSQRRDSNPSPTSTDALVAPMNPPQPLANAIDQLAMNLGVGWKKVPAESAAAWAKFIHNHYKDILEPVILLENEGQHAYLVKVNFRGREQLWLFQEDLSLGQCLSNTLEGAVINLRTGEREGPIVYKCERSPNGVLMPTAAESIGPVEVDVMELA